jgi:D-glycero-D-manno-heptose 1,7-bisphosphate phosphatase
MDLVILDRDGVINYDSDSYIKSPEEWKAIPGSLQAIARLNQSGCRVVVATNQSGLGRRLFDLESLICIHEKMQRELAEVGGVIDAIFFCPHKPQDRCKCRKPRPGMLLDLAARLSIPLHGVPVIGDSLRDVEAARAVGAHPVLVLTGKGRSVLGSGQDLKDISIYEDLAAAVDDLLTRSDRQPTTQAGRNRC